MSDRPKRKVTYSLPEDLIDSIAAVVKEGAAPSYSAFVQKSLEEGVANARENALAEAFEKAGNDPAFLSDVSDTMKAFRQVDDELESEKP